MMAEKLVHSSAEWIFEKRAIPGLTLEETIAAHIEMKTRPPEQLVSVVLKAIAPTMLDLYGDPPLGRTPSQATFAIMLAGFFMLQNQGDFDLKKIHQRILPASESDTTSPQESVSKNKKIVAKYRHHFKMTGLAPTSDISDQVVIDLHERVTTSFKKVASERNENLTDETLNFIVLKFLQMYEDLGSEFTDEHLAYEIQKYKNEGLRPDYKQGFRS